MVREDHRELVADRGPVHLAIRRSFTQRVAEEGPRMRGLPDLAHPKKGDRAYDRASYEITLDEVERIGI